MNTRSGKERIYGPSKLLDYHSAQFAAGAERFRKGALRQRWDAAPAWANCFIKPTEYGVREGGLDPDDYRWANVNELGNATLGEHDGAEVVSVLVEHDSLFSICEKRPSPEMLVVAEGR
ncbi:hypothetical protein HNP46_005788 [Pseudomonas nitritireducens]|uniref:Uncharacterized protein n=1 Tax=Pseudomonas nitroreducens TaxID=46680 RepID=A0A7W7KQM7_PSENT|nr:hypothetical protein [Pseudomonas nitritireducens]MBB4866881.1 hypothetical protein [Pseudomonas nitritireducens]